MTAARPRVIVLNGPGSSGKSSAARALQKIARGPLIHVAMDAFLDMLPDSLIGHPDGLAFDAVQIEGHRTIIVRTGPVCERLLTGMRASVAALARAGNDLIVDDVMLRGEIAIYRDLLPFADLRFVGFFLPLEVLEAREAARGDREIGLARGQVDSFSREDGYDLIVDNPEADPERIAAEIRDAFGL